MFIPNIWQNKIHVPNQQPYIYIYIYYRHLSDIKQKYCMISCNIPFLSPKTITETFVHRLRTRVLDAIRGTNVKTRLRSGLAIRRHVTFGLVDDYGGLING